MEVTRELQGGVLSASVSGHVDTSTAGQLEAELLPYIGGVKEAVIDCENLEYISSSGLRVLLKLKKTGLAVRLINVSSVVYEILDVTGFIELLDVKKALRKISIDGCEKIGQGYNGAVYRLDADTIVKIYREGIPLKEIDEERKFAKTAFIKGVPTAIAYDVVRAGDSYGTVYELMDSDTLGHAFVKYPERFDELLDKYVALVRMVGDTHMSGNGLDKTQNLLHERIERYRGYLPDEDLELVNSLIDCMPECDTLVHGDLHPGNIMLQGNDLMLIDMAELTVGPYGYELLRLYNDTYESVKDEKKKSCQIAEKSMGMPRELILKVWDGFIRRYLETDDEEKIKAWMGKMSFLILLNKVISSTKAPKEAFENAIPTLKTQLIDGLIKPKEQELRCLLADINGFGAHASQKPQ